MAPLVMSFVSGILEEDTRFLDLRLDDNQKSKKVPKKSQELDPRPNLDKPYAHSKSKIPKEILFSFHRFLFTNSKNL